MKSSHSELELVFRSSYASLVRALAVASSPEEASEAVQDAFVQAVRHWPRVGQYDDPVAWVRRAAINRLANQHRRRRRHEVAMTRLPLSDSVTDPEPDVGLAAAVRSLPRQQRLAVCLYYLADLPVAAVADALGVSGGTVKSHLADARRSLRIHREVQP